MGEKWNAVFCFEDPCRGAEGGSGVARHEIALLPAFGSCRIELLRKLSEYAFLRDGAVAAVTWRKLTVALLVATAVRFIAPLQVAPVYWGLAPLAGVVGGLIFGQAFNVCAWDRCASAWLVLPYAAGWISWQALVCIAIFVGSRRIRAPDSAYGVNLR